MIDDGYNWKNFRRVVFKRSSHSKFLQKLMMVDEEAAEYTDAIVPPSSNL